MSIRLNSVNIGEGDETIDIEDQVQSKTDGLRKRSVSGSRSKNQGAQGTGALLSAIPEDDALFAVQDDHEFGVFTQVTTQVLYCFTII